VPAVASAAMTAVVRADGLTKSWGATLALDGATLEIGRGVTGLLGANGAGKTTLFGLLLGLHPPDGGALEVLGLDPTRAGAEVRARIGYAPEHDALPPDMRAHDLVRHIAEVHGLPHREAVSRASDALWHVGLGEERFRPVGTMSTGQRQRVKLAQALAHDPALVLLDEPTNGLDPVQREEMLHLVRRVGSEFGIDVVLSSHLLDEVERVCDGVVILARGRVVAAGAMHTLRGEGTDIVIDIDGDPDHFAAALTSRGFTASVAAGRVTVAASDAAFDAVRDTAVAAGVGIRRLERRTTTLEDVFLQAGRQPAAPGTWS
jgi:ABC-2 type transport system ATP-binding protein